MNTKTYSHYTYQTDIKKYVQATDIKQAKLLLIKWYKKVYPKLNICVKEEDILVGYKSNCFGS